MERLIYLSDSVVLALLYRYQVTRNKMMSFEQIVEFDRLINENLIEMNVKPPKGYYYSYEQPELYFVESDGENMYAIIDPNVDIQKERRKYLGIIPFDIVFASQKENALSAIGLKLEDGHLKENLQKKRELK